MLLFSENTIFGSSRISLHFLNSIFQGIQIGLPSDFWIVGMYVCSSFYKIPSLKIQLPLFLAVIYHFPRIKRSSKNCPCVMWGHLFWRWVWKENCFSDLPNFMYCVESCQLTYLVQKLGTKRMRSMHSAQDCKSKFYCKGQRPQICFADIYGKLSLNDYILLFLHLWFYLE